MVSELSAQFSPWKSEHYFYEQHLAADETSHTCVSLRCFWKNFTYFHRDGDSDFPAQSHLKIWTLFLLAVIWRWDGVFGGSDAFFSVLSRS